MESSSNEETWYVTPEGDIILEDSGIPSLSRKKRGTLGMICALGVTAIIGVYGSYRAVSADRAINRAFLELVDTDRDGNISLEEKKPVADYFNARNSANFIGFGQASEIREKGSDAEWDSLTKRAYLIAMGIDGNFYSGMEF